LKIDKQLRDISNKLDSISNYGNGKYKHHDDSDDYDEDFYYIDRNDIPPRFLLYGRTRAEKWEASGPHQPSDFDESITQDELDYGLKRRLRMSPEQRYQAEKREWSFHDLSYFHQTIDDTGKCVDVIKEYGCGYNRGGCVPECRFYPEDGRIEDEEVIEEHNKLVESARRDNEIVEPPSEAELQRLAKTYRFDLI
jgi:hypothetical protein